ncbi:MAG: hypothetical protein IJ704_00315 [Bacilli bacterium]|nr:hypothetical protein [Bacilli bacterium]
MEEIKYTLKQIINNTAYIEFGNGKTALLNIENDQIIGNIGMYTVITKPEKQLFIQVKSEGSKRIVNIYDASKGEFVFFGWELMLQVEDNYSRMALKSPIDGKIQLFDCESYKATYQTKKQSVVYDPKENHFYPQGFKPDERIEFLQDIVVFQNQGKIVIYDYNGTQLKEYSKDIEIKEFKNAENKYLYCIDGSFYVYNAIEKKLKEVHTREVRVYTTIYETDTHFYTLRGYDKESCKSFCERIESLPEEEAKRILNQMSDPKILQRDYPTLSLVKQKKL